MKAAKSIIVLTAIAAAAAALLSLVNTGTAASRDASDREFKLASLREVLPEYENEPDGEAMDIELPGGKPARLYPARGPGEVYVGVAVELSTPPAYGGTIGMLVGVDVERRVHGLKILPGHQETPGLGAKVEEEGWRKQFHGLVVVEEGRSWKVRKDDPNGMIDEVTGATITSRAVTSAVETALMAVESNIHAIPGAVPEPEPVEEPEPPPFSEEEFRQKALEAVLPEFDNAPEKNAVTVDLEGGGTAVLYPARRQNAIVGMAVEIETPQAYAGVLTLLVGVDARQRVTGVRIFPGHQETPGSGDLVEGDEWLAGFEGKTLDGEGKTWKVTGDDESGAIDEITGATITCRAVVTGVADGLAVIRDNWNRCE